MILALAALFWTLYFLTCAIWLSSQTFLEDLGPRLTFPLMWSGCTFFLWQHIASMAPRFGTFLFYNPVTHISEGIRSALIANHYGIALQTSACFLAIISIGLLLALLVGVYVRLEIVRHGNEN